MLESKSKWTSTFVQELSPHKSYDSESANTISTSHTIHDMLIIVVSDQRQSTKGKKQK